MEQWIKSIRSGVTDEFITPFPPRRDTPVHVSLEVQDTSRAKRIVCHTVLDGNSHYVTMHGEQRGTHMVYKAVIPPAHESKWYFSFQIETEDGWYFATRRGILAYHPSITSMYEVDVDLDIAPWVAGSTFYQIFPDRFRNALPSIGVKTGEYRFDGHETIVLEEGTVPPPYEEGWCLDFYNGDLEGIARSIDHFTELGITALYLNPICSAKTNHRYDCTDFFHVDEHLGGDQALVSLSERLHTADIRLMLDISINHSGVAHPWFKRAQQDNTSEEATYYYRDDSGDFVFWEDVKTLPQLNYSSENLRRIMYKGEQSVLRKFIRPPFAIDAWRFDVGTDTGRHGTDQMSHEIWREVRTALKEEKAETYIIGEAWEDASAYIQGDQWDSAMNYFGSGRLLRRWYGQQDTYLMSDWGHSDETGRPLTGKELSDAIAQHLHAIPDQLVPVQFNLIDSHDTMRLHNHKRIFDWDLYEGIVMLLYLLPGVPNIYYGDEIGLEGTIESNEGARYPMVWDRNRWDSRFFSLYKGLGALRKDNDICAKGDWRTEWYDDTTVVFSRTYRERGLMIILNRSLEEKSVTVDLRHLTIKRMEDWETGLPVDPARGILRWDARPKKSSILRYEREL